MPLAEDGKPIVFFMGAQFCPFCAAERWAFVRATSRFGTWTGLGPLSSQAGSYRSDLVSLHHKEVADLEGNPLQPLVGIEQDLVNRYDPSGGFPFVATTGDPGQYTVGLSYSPALLQGRRFADVQADVGADSTTPASRAVNGEADAITALICRLTNNQPATVCGQASIRGLEASLP